MAKFNSNHSSEVVGSEYEPRKEKPVRTARFIDQQQQRSINLMVTAALSMQSASEISGNSVEQICDKIKNNMDRFFYIFEKKRELLDMQRQLKGAMREICNDLM